jgi:hypothetical protein
MHEASGKLRRRGSRIHDNVMCMQRPEARAMRRAVINALSSHAGGGQMSPSGAACSLGVFFCQNEQLA